MKQPQRVEGARLCLSVSKDGVKAYGNRESFTSLARWLEWIAAHDPSEHFECHVRWHLEDEESKFQGKRPQNTWVKMEGDVAAVFEQELQLDADTRQDGFELTFMAVTEQELDTMARESSWTYHPVAKAVGSRRTTVPILWSK